MRAPTSIPSSRPLARLPRALARLLRDGAGDGALEQERALRRPIAALVAAPDRDAVLDAGLTAVAGLLGPGARAVIAVPGAHGIVVRGEELPDATARLALRGEQPQGVLAVAVDGRLQIGRAPCRGGAAARP